jgi:electron transport complex protein RnfB
MDTENQVYRELQQHLDRLPSGFPAAESGVDMRLLKRLFTPEEAEIAIQLSMKPEPLKRIFSRVKKSGITKERLQQILDQMHLKGTLLKFEEGYQEKYYSNAGFGAGGTYDFQIGRLTKDLVEDQYQHRVETRPKPKAGQKRTLPLRAVPVEKSIPIPGKFKVGNYDNLREIIHRAKGPLAVVNCICREGHDLIGESCKLTDLRETCLMIDPDHARRQVEMGIARHITKDEALDILKKAQDAGLVIQPENSQQPEAICCCCGDCCVLLQSLKKHPRPVELYDTNYYVELIPESCTGCGECVEICQLDAREMENGVAAVNLDRCIGCGNCVVVCEYDATRLMKKAEEKIPVKDKDALNMKMLSDKVGRLKVQVMKMKMMLGLKV